MRDLFTIDSHSISAGHAVSGIANHARTLRVLRGRVWITVEGIPHDYFLHAGDTFTAIPGRLVVVEADQDAGIDMLCDIACRTSGSLGNRIAGFMARFASGGTVKTSLTRHQACCGTC